MKPIDMGLTYFEKLEKVLARTGNLHTLDDVLEFIRVGKMQSFVRNNTWIITAINDYPRRRVLDVAYLVGDLDDAEVLHDDVVKFARDTECTMIRTYGRFGWKAYAEKHGWQAVDVIYVKDLRQ